MCVCGIWYTFYYEGDTELIVYCLLKNSVSANALESYVFLALTHRYAVV